MNKKSLLAVIISAFTLLPAHADDFGLWTDAGLSQKLGNTGLTADVGLGMRLNNNWNNIDRWNLGVALSYDIFKFLETSVGYDLIYSYNQSATKPNYNTAGVWRGYNVENAYWRPKNRLHVDLKGKAKVGRFSFSLRERYQLTAYNHRWLRQDKYRFNQWGRVKIAQALRLKQLPPAAIEEGLLEIDEDEYADILRSLITRKLRTVKAASDYDRNSG